MKGIDVKELSLSARVLKVLCSEEGIQKVNHELESNEVEAICFIDKDAKIVGTSAAHVDAAEKLVNELMLEKQVKVDAKSDHLLKSTDWIKICDEINAKSTAKTLCTSVKMKGSVNHELESNEVEAICFIDKDAKIVGMSAAHVDAAEKLMNELILEKQVKVDVKGDHLLKSTEWIKICDEINAKSTVCVHGNVWNDTPVVGFKDEVSDVLEKLSAFLEDNYIKQEDDVCISELMRKYIGEFHENNLRSIEDQLKEFYVSIENGERPEHFEISGNREGLKRARKKLDHLTNDIASHAFDIEQLGLPKYLDTEKGRCLVKSVEKEQDCVIGLKENLCRESETESTASTGEEEMTIEEGNEYDDEINHESDNNNDSVGTADDDKCDDNDEVDQNDASGCGLNDVTTAVDEGTTGGNDTSTLVTTHGHNISWKPGFIEQEKADVLVSSHGEAIKKAGAPWKPTPDVGEVIVSCGLTPATHVMLTHCCEWDGVKGGTAEKQDQLLKDAFKKEMNKLKAKYKDAPKYRLHRLLQSFRLKTKQGPAQTRPEPVRIGLEQGDICKEKTDAIVNVLSKDLNMDNSGELSKAVKEMCGQAVQEELNKLKRQPTTSVVITSGGNLPARHIIHLIPESSDKDHLQQGVEKCLQLAETKGLSSISIPAIGTGKHLVSAVDSRNLIFKAIQSFEGRCNSVRKVRIVIFQAKMLPAFQQEQFKLSHHLEEDASRRTIVNSPFSVEVTTGDLTKENTSDAIMNIASADMNLNNAGELSKAIAKVCGPPGSPDLQHLQQCLEEGLRLADTKSLKSTSIPCIGTGGYILVAAQSAQVTFQALRSFSANCKSIRKVKVVVLKTDLKKEFELLQTQQGQHLKSVVGDEGSGSDKKALRRLRKRRRRQEREPVQRYSVKVCVVGKDKPSVENAAKSLHDNFAQVFVSNMVESGDISELSQNQIRKLKREASEHDVKMEVEAEPNLIVVQGKQEAVQHIVQEIWKMINERTKQEYEEDIGQYISKNIVWSYELYGNVIEFGTNENKMIELAHSKGDDKVEVSLGTEQFIIDVKHKVGPEKDSDQQIRLERKVKEADEAALSLFATVPLSVAGRGKVSHLSGNADLSLGGSDGRDCVDVDCRVGNGGRDCVDVDKDSPLGGCGNCFDVDCSVDVGDGDCVSVDFPVVGGRDWVDVDFPLCGCSLGTSVDDFSVGNGMEACADFDSPMGSGGDSFNVDVNFCLVGSGGGISLGVNVDCPVGSGIEACVEACVDFDKPMVSGSGDLFDVDVDFCLGGSGGGISLGVNVDCPVGSGIEACVEACVDFDKPMVSGSGDLFDVDVDFCLGGSGGGISVNVNCPVGGGMEACGDFDKPEGSGSGDFCNVDVDFPLGGGICDNFNCSVGGADNGSVSVGVDFPFCGTGDCDDVVSRVDCGIANKHDVDKDYPQGGVGDLVDVVNAPPLSGGGVGGFSLDAVSPIDGGGRSLG
ncbi:Poly [ADP-ribose] polymerase 14 [Stylophora pistillata]|uniref:Poly [ADP-ribose] polymerase 14 n=1 Tax=Stylophora pistillata TaxID=50429 RepID=A0A2B4RY78_STYPI|nr:Poly [ADP-ribose] polymerase 14 [Stylophora pistillata]